MRMRFRLRLRLKMRMRMRLRLRLRLKMRWSTVELNGGDVQSGWRDPMLQLYR